MYLCIAPLSRFYYPETRRFINAFYYYYYYRVKQQVNMSEQHNNNKIIIGPNNNNKTLFQATAHICTN